MTANQKTQQPSKHQPNNPTQSQPKNPNNTLPPSGVVKCMYLLGVYTVGLAGLLLLWARQYLPTKYKAQRNGQQADIERQQSRTKSSQFIRKRQAEPIGPLGGYRERNLFRVRQPCRVRSSAFSSNSIYFVTQSLIFLTACAPQQQQSHFKAPFILERASKPFVKVAAPMPPMELEGIAPAFVHHTNNICTNCPQPVRICCMPWVYPVSFTNVTLVSYNLMWSSNMVNWKPIDTNFVYTCDSTNTLRLPIAGMPGNVGFLRVKLNL